MPHCTLSSGSLHYVDRGAGPVLLLVHGFPLDHSIWSEQLQGLTGLRLIAPDLPGFGASDPLADDEPLTMGALSDVLAELLAALEIRQPVAVAGLSMGGYAALDFWARHRERLGRLILCDTRAAADSPEAAAARDRTAEEVLRAGVDAVVDGMLPKLFHEPTLRRGGPAVESTTAVMRGTAPRTVAAALRGMARRQDRTGDASQIDCPCLLICGEHDAITPADEMRALAESIPGAELRVIADAGHLAPLEQPGPVNSAIAEFCRGD